MVRVGSAKVAFDDDVRGERQLQMSNLRCSVILALVGERSRGGGGYQCRSGVRDKAQPERNVTAKGDVRGIRAGLTEGTRLWRGETRENLGEGE